MSKTKAARIIERLAEIKARAAEMQAARTTRSNAVSAEDLAEEAAGLGLELAELLTEKKG